MEQPHIVTPTVEREASEASVSVDLKGGDPLIVRVRASEKIGREATADALLPLLLFPAMRHAASLRLPEPVSPRLLGSIPKAQEILRCWFPKRYRRVAVEAEARKPEATNRAPGVGCFFSGGVDSFYTAIKRRQEITHLIFSPDFGVPAKDPAVRREAIESVRRAASSLGKPLVEVETNAMKFSYEARVGWAYYHGSALATIGLLLGSVLGKVYVPSTHSYDNLFPWGSHPLLDPLWSTEVVEIVHDGAEATRVEKTALISGNDTAMKNLRVCTNEEQTDINCGRCTKCRRTVINLIAVGAEGRCDTLPSSLSPQEVRGMCFPDESYRSFGRETLEALRTLGTKPELVRALAAALRFSETKDSSEEISALRQRLQKSKKKLDRLRAELEELRRQKTPLSVRVLRRIRKLR